MRGGNMGTRHCIREQTLTRKSRREKKTKNKPAWNSLISFWRAAPTNSLSVLLKQSCRHVCCDAERQVLSSEFNFHHSSFYSWAAGTSEFPLCGISDLSVYPVLAYLAAFVMTMKTIQIFTIPGNVCEIILKNTYPKHIQSCCWTIFPSAGNGFSGHLRGCNLILPPQTVKRASVIDLWEFERTELFIY